jgi:hypothetical protein
MPVSETAPEKALSRKPRKIAAFAAGLRCLRKWPDWVVGLAGRTRLNKPNNLAEAETAKNPDISRCLSQRSVSGEVPHIGTPEPDMQSPASRQTGRAEWQTNHQSNVESGTTPLVVQACKLRRGKTVTIAFLLTAPPSLLLGVAA